MTRTTGAQTQTQMMGELLDLAAEILDAIEKERAAGDGRVAKLEAVANAAERLCGWCRDRGYLSKELGALAAALDDLAEATGNTTEHSQEDN